MQEILLDGMLWQACRINSSFRFASSLCHNCTPASRQRLAACSVSGLAASTLRDRSFDQESVTWRGLALSAPCFGSLG